MFLTWNKHLGKNTLNRRIRVKQFNCNVDIPEVQKFGSFQMPRREENNIYLRAGEFSECSQSMQLFGTAVH